MAAGLTLVSWGFNGAALFRARRAPRAPGGSAPCTSFNGAALFRARRDVDWLPLLCVLRVLQRGRALSSAESADTVADALDAAIASTGPRSFERGEVVGNRRRGRAADASTGPRSFERGELSRQRSLARSSRGFNGAALFRARRAAAPRRPSRTGGCFNGAALFRARRERERCVSRKGFPASTGPRSFERGEAITASEACALWLASTGPRSFERGEVTYRSISLAGRKPDDCERRHDGLMATWRIFTRFTEGVD